MSRNGDYMSMEGGDFILFRIYPGKDLFHTLLSIAKEHGVEFGTLMSLIGRVKPVNVAGYARDSEAVKVSKDNNGYELVSGTGNVGSSLQLPSLDIKYAGNNFLGEGGYLIGGTAVLELATGMIANCRLGYENLLAGHGVPFQVNDGNLRGGLERTLAERDIKSGGIFLTGGTLDSVEIGFFHSDKGQYGYRTFDNEYGFDIKDGQGTLAFEDGELKPHIHLGFKAVNTLLYGGHLVDAKVIKPVTGYTIAVPGVVAERVKVSGSQSRRIEFCGD